MVKKKDKEVEITKEELGSFHQLDTELQESLIEAGRSYKSKMRRYFDDALAAQGAARRRKEEIALEKKCADVREEYIVAIYFHEQMSSPRCWRTQERADFFYKALKSETARLRAVKD